MPFARNSDLPKPIRDALPTAAQTIWRKAFNAQLDGGDDADDESAAKVAWAAVKEAGYSKSGDKWSKDSSPQPVVDHVTMKDVYALDSQIIVTDEGYLKSSPRIARVGVQDYLGIEVGKPSMDVVRVYRPDQEVFSVDALRSVGHIPITMDHPAAPVDAKTWRKLAVGHLSGEVARDGQFIRIPMMLMDAEAVSAVKSGKRNLSVGYTCDIEWTAGETEDGEKYDAIQRNIRANHLAIVTKARGGDKLAIGDDHQAGEKMMKILVDGIECEVADVSAAVINRHLKSLTAEIDDLKSKLDRDQAKAKEEAAAAKEAADAAAVRFTAESKTKDEEIAALKKQVEDSALTPQKLDSLVASRVATVGKAKAVLGDKLAHDGKTEAEIKRQVVDAKLGDQAKGYSDEHVAIAFDALTKDAKPAQDQQQHGGINILARSFSRDFQPQYDSSNPQAMRDKAYDDYVKRLQNGGTEKSA